MKMKLLILHPDDLFRRRLIERMRLDNHRVLETSIEAEADEIILRENLDVVLIGVRGSHQNGISILKKIRKLRPFTEVILLTAAEDHSFDGAIKAMQLGAFDDLMLPIDINTLTRRILEAFKRKKTRVRNKKEDNGNGQEGSLVKQVAEHEMQLHEGKQ
jgi:DNA-binding NtrC family response regulator